MSTRFRTLWTLSARHAFHAGGGDTLEFLVPPATQRALAGVRALARERDGVLHVLIEVDDAQQPLADVLGRRFVFGVRPREATFELITQPLGLGAGESPLWANTGVPGALDTPRGVLLSAGGALRIAPRSAARPLTLSVFDAGGVRRAQGVLTAGVEALSLPIALSAGEWRIEEAGGAPAWRLFVEPGLLATRAWGLVDLTVDASHLANPPAFHLDFAARSDTLRYYVVASRLSQAEFDQVSVVDGGFVAEGRAQIVFNRVLPPAFNAQHLPSALLDPAGAARVALFEAQGPTTRRERGPTRLELHRNGDVLVGNLPQPGAQRSDAQFVVHLSKP